MPPADRLRATTCGVLVLSGGQVLLGHATRSVRWDIPKGMAEPGEAFGAAAVRELAEETGLQVRRDALVELGVFPYLREKDLALFAWWPGVMPDVAVLHCRSMVVLPGGMTFPEMDRFGVFDWGVALGMVGRSMARVLAGVSDRADGADAGAGKDLGLR